MTLYPHFEFPFPDVHPLWHTVHFNFAEFWHTDYVDRTDRHRGSVKIRLIRVIRVLCRSFFPIQQWIAVDSPILEVIFHIAPPSGAFKPYTKGLARRK